MTLPALLAQLGSLAEARAQALLLARAATELPGIAATLEPAGLRLAARHIRAHVFGTRHRRRDPRLALFLRGSR